MHEIRMIRSGDGPARLGALFLCLLTPAGTAAAPPSSTSYVLQQRAAGAAGAESASTSYRLGGTAGQAATIGTSSSPGFVVQSGFWSFAGSGLVPVWLVVEQNGVDPQHIDLSWSGNNPLYSVYEATDCANVTGSLLVQTGSNFYLDIDPPVADLVCYLVLATAPGPESHSPGLVAP